MNGDRSTYNNQLEQSTCCHMHLARKGTITVENAKHTAGTSRSMLKTSPPWGHRHDTPPRTGNGMPNVIAQLLQPQKQLFITGEVLSEAGCSQRKGFLHPTDRMCLPMLRPIFTQSCGKETPCGKCPSHTSLGYRRCLIVSRSSRGCERPCNSTCDKFSELHFGLPTTVNSFARFLRAGSHRMLWII